ncbi:MAG: hypothetical protein RLZZ303_2287 [Candidatus Hydrogenedentota bacterium]
MNRVLRRGAALLGLLVILLLIAASAAYFLFTGPTDLGAYPEPADSPYLLPWSGGETRFCIQGNRAVVSHRGWETFAYDFTMPVGTPVRAARAGEVVQVVQEHDGNGYQWPNNRVAIRHEDGTIGHYLHIKRNGSRVQVGDRVEQGQVICESGNVGNSMLPHLHFHVTNAERNATLPISFADVDSDQGVPRMLHHYTSGNSRD